MGGTCVNRGCVPSKALLAASGRVREMQNEGHLSEFGITVEGGKDSIKYDREGVANHAKQLANRVKGNLEGSLVALGVDIVEGKGILTGKANEVKDDASGKVYTAKVSFFESCKSVARGALLKVQPSPESDLLQSSVTVD